MSPTRLPLYLPDYRVLNDLIGHLSSATQKLQNGSRTAEITRRNLDIKYRVFHSVQTAPGLRSNSIGELPEFDDPAG